MRTFRFLLATPALKAAGSLAIALVVCAAAVHCGSKEPEENPGTPDTGQEEAGETGDVGDAETTPSDGTPDTADVGPTVTCTKPPVFEAPLRVNHNPDSLRRVARAGMVLLDDGKIMVAMLEAVDLGTRYAVWARVVDPDGAKKVGEDERLDVDTDLLLESSNLQIFNIEGGAVGVRYGDTHVRVWSKGKWSPDLAATMPIASGDALGFLASSSGQVLVTRARSSAPYGQATVYRPDEGGVKGSWSAPQTLDLDGASSQPRIDRHVLADGRFLTLIWHGTGGPAVRTRSLSGAWTSPSARAEIGSIPDGRPAYAVLDDGSIVLVALEGTGDTRRAVTSTWTSTEGWSTARLVSKLPGDTNAVLPNNGSPFLFAVSPKEVEFVAWVAGCAGAAKDCDFEAVSRRYSGGAWKDPVALDVGGTGVKGPDGLSVVALDAQTPLVARASADRTAITMRVRIDAEWKPATSILKDSPLFGTAQVDARFFGGWPGVWSLARRDPGADAGTTTPLAVAVGKIDPGTGASWGTVIAGSYEMRDFGSMAAYADGAGGFTVAVNNATDGSKTAPIIAHAGPTGGTPEAVAVISSDESSASFVAFPRTSPRRNRDRSALFLVQAKPSDATALGNRLRAYAWNGVGGGVPKLLAADTKRPRAFGDGLLVYGCGGALLYAVDPIDGSNALELVLVKEKSDTTDGGT